MTVTTEQETPAPAPTGTDTVVTVQAKDLIRILSNAAIFAETGKLAIPVLQAVRLESDSDTLTAVATDRHTLGLDTAVLGEVRASFATLLELADIKRITDLLKVWAKFPTAEATVTVAEAKVTVSVYDSALSVRPVEGEFPRFRSLFPSDDATSDGVAVIGLAPKYLARLAKVDGGVKNAPAVLSFAAGDRKPVKVTVGETFVGLLMPVRIAS